MEVYEAIEKYEVKNITDSNLLSMYIKNADELLKQYNMLELGQKTWEWWTQFDGVGTKKAKQIHMMFEIGRRAKSKPFNVNEKLLSPITIANKYVPRFLGLDHEEFWCLYLNTSNQLKKEVMISKGSLNQTIVHPREVFRPAVELSANAIILMHNHPSGNPEPSKPDIKLTLQLVEASKIMDIKILDHIIIAGEKYTSMLSEGLM